MAYFFISFCFLLSNNCRNDKTIIPEKSDFLWHGMSERTFKARENKEGSVIYSCQNIPLSLYCGKINTMFFSAHKQKNNDTTSAVLLNLTDLP